jgi:putative ABC transport system ATP-binding protein
MTTTPATHEEGELPSQRQAAVARQVVCRGVTKDFGAGATRVQALRGVDLEICCGEVTLLVGPSGCGKTTLISVIAGLLDPTAGDVAVLGDNLTQMSSGRKTRFRGRNIGFAFQQYNLLPALTATENAAIPLMANGWARRRALAKATDLIQAVGLARRADALPSQLSGGEQQRVAIARALVHEPRLLLCDEPTSALDGQTGHAVMELIRDVGVRPDRVVLVVTHDNRIFPLGDRIVHMLDGIIEKIETRGKAQESPRPRSGISPEGQP